VGHVFYRSAVGGVEEIQSGVRSTLNPNSSTSLPATSAAGQSSVQQGQGQGQAVGSHRLSHWFQGGLASDGSTLQTGLRQC